jgi:hypothetical protein
VSDEYVIRLEDRGPPRRDLSDPGPGVSFVVERGESTARFGVLASGTLASFFSELDREQIENVLIAAGLEELERQIRAGLFPPEEEPYAEILFTSDQHEHIRAIADRDKACLWQERLERGWICTATRPGGDDRTSAPLCKECPIPDERVLCVHLMHPQIDSFGGTGGISTRSVVSHPLCNVGNDPNAGAACLIGGLSCARRHVSTGRTMPDPPADVARLAADEADFFTLVYHDRYGSRVWAVPQARTISEFFGDCEGPEDFQRRVAALADFLARLNPYKELEEEERVDRAGKRVGSLVALERLIERDHPEAVPAVKTLRAIAAARNAFPIHTGSDKLVAALRDLGIAFPPADWRLAWLQVLTAFMTSLAEIRAAIQTHTPEEEEDE